MFPILETPLTMRPIGTTHGSKQHICCKTVSLVLVVTANCTVNVLVLWGVEIRNIHNFDETWMIVSLWYKQEAQLSLTNHAMLFCKVLDVLSENLDKKFTTQVPNYYSAIDLAASLQLNPFIVPMSMLTH